jgi:membrane-associated protease RseP (regulator of RpoE activity)
MNSFHVPASHGLEIVVIDHDAPAAKAGLKEHDVILRANGETVESVEKFRRMVRETPPGHLIALIISRDGREMTIPVKVADRAEVEKQAWSQHMTIIPESDMDMSMFSAQKFGPPVPGSGFFATMTASAYYTGVIVDALGPQLASFFGAQTGLGLLVKSVDAHSPAANAGIKAGDVITKVGTTQMATRNDFYRAIRENKGKQVSVTLLRDKKEQTVTLNVGEGKNTKSLVDPPSFPEMVEVQRLNGDVDEIQLAELQPEIEEAIADAQAAIGPEMDKVREQMKVLQPQLQKDMQRMQEEMRKMEPQLREQMKQLQNIEPQIREQMKQLQNIEPQIREQMKNLQNIEPQIREQMKQFREMEPMIREQILVQRTPLV